MKMKKYYVDYGTGAGNYYSDLELDELKNEVAESLTYSQSSVSIFEVNEEDRDNWEEVAITKWWSTQPEEDEEVLAEFGSFGYYSVWE